jgi:endonuclease/exonuclease/phosphatase family metal-dependent hydrolase
MDRRAYLLENLRRYPTVSELKESAFFAECGAEIESILANAELHITSGTGPLRRSFLRVVQWNIEKGRRIEAILEAFRSNAVLRHADLILLNEADCGMSRSGNLHTALSLATALGMNLAFGPAHLELTRGTGDDLELPGDNRESLQGNAVLSRYPILEACIVPLPVCFEPYEFHEKRYGRRNCLWAGLQVAGRRLWAGSVHLEVRNTPRCRAIQMAHLLGALPGEEGDAWVLAGDLNANSFSRGTPWRTLKSASRLVAVRPMRLKEQLLHPERGSEPLFTAVRRAGFFWEGLNSFDATASASIADLEDSKFLPGFLADLVRQRISSHEDYLHFKLDWILGRGVRPLTAGEVVDSERGIASLEPGTTEQQRIGPGRISDHTPIYADLALLSGQKR